METITIKYVEKKEEIYDLLIKFTPVLHSLSTGRIEKEVFASKLANNGTVVGLFQMNDIAAFAAFYCNDNISQTAFLSMLAVVPECKRMGYGKKVMEIVIDYSRKQGMQKLRLEVQKENWSAIKFYKKLNFNFIDEKTETSYFMQLDL